MKEYIERAAAVKAAQAGADEWDGGFNRNRDMYIEAAIDKVPAADVQTNKRGKARTENATGLTLYVMTDDVSHELIGIWSSREKATGWLVQQLVEGAWTLGEAAFVSINQMTVQ